jgi:hypothetical protein
MFWFSEEVGKNPGIFILSLTNKQVILISFFICLNIFFIWLQVPLLNSIKYILNSLWI